MSFKMYIQLIPMKEKKRWNIYILVLSLNAEKGNILGK